jgi:hypothetical protein
VAAVVLAIAAVLPNLLPKAFTIATETYVDQSVAAAYDAGISTVEDNTRQIGQLQNDVGVIKVDLGHLVEGQQKARASQEAERVTSSIRNSNRRVREYRRVYEAAIANQRGGRDPLEGVRLP